MGVGAGHEASCGCAMCAAQCEHDENHEHGGQENRGNALAGYGVPNGGIGDALVGGRIWAAKELTYGFPTDAAQYDQNASIAGIQYGEGEPTDGFAPLTEDQRQAAEFAIAQIAAVTELTFVRDDTAADIRIAQSGVPSSAWAYYPDKSAQGGDIWFGNTRGYYDDPVKGSYGGHAFLHELGHAVGLKHGHEQGVTGAGRALAVDRDTMEWSVMTYRSYVGDPMENGYSNENAGFAQSLMRVDIAALQQLYGANYDHQSGDTRYSWDPETGELHIDGAGQGAPVANRVFETIWDGGGEDVIDASAYQSNVSIDLAPGAGSVLSDTQLAFLNKKEGDDAIYASANVYLAELHEDDARGLIENAIGGSGDDRLTGNVGDNKLSGAGGSDLIWGLTGSDTLLGGGGGDRLVGGGGKDRLAGQSGADKLSGGNGRDRLAGGGGQDELDGGRGRDKLIGGGGSDALTGGRGGDQLTGGGGADVFRFARGDGADRIMDFSVAQDQIDLSQFGTGFEALTIVDTEGGARVMAGDVSILLVRNNADEMTVDQFIF